MSRLSVLIIVACALLCGWLARGPARYVPSAAELIRWRADSIKHSATVERLDSMERASIARARVDSLRLDSLRQAFRSRPIREVVRYLPGGRDTVELETVVVESVMVAAPVIRETADSLATCRADRSGLADSVALWRVREASQREAADLLRNRPPVEPAEPPSRLPWVGAGFAAGLTTAAIIILWR